MEENYSMNRHAIHHLSCIKLMNRLQLRKNPRPHIKLGHLVDEKVSFQLGLYYMGILCGVRLSMYFNCVTFIRPRILIVMDQDNSADVLLFVLLLVENRNVKITLLESSGSVILFAFSLVFTWNTRLSG